MKKPVKKPTKKVVKKVAKKVTKSVKKLEEKPDIWIVLVQLNGSMECVKISSDHSFYNSAVLSGNYTLTEAGSKRVIKEGKKLFETIRKSEK